MTRQPELVEVVCVRCGTVCTAYLHESADHAPDRWSADGEELVATICPECGAALDADALLQPNVLGAHPSR